MHKQQKIKKSKKYRFLPKKKLQKNKKKIRKVFNKISSSFLRSLMTISDQRTVAEPEKFHLLRRGAKFNIWSFFAQNRHFSPRRSMQRARSRAPKINTTRRGCAKTAALGRRAGASPGVSVRVRDKP